jgi:SAM-dependent methyltransferase
MVAAAIARGIDARLMRAEAIDLPERFDAAFSNAALHWVRDHDGVADGLARHLVPGGRVVGELGGHGNIAGILTAIIAVLDRYGVDGRAVNPWHFPTAPTFRRVLETHGFAVDEIALIPRPTPLPSGMAAWLTTFGGTFLASVGPAQRGRVVSEIVDLLSSSLRDDEGMWTADYVRLRFVAHTRG